MNKKYNFVSAHIQKYPFTFAGTLLAGFIGSCVSFLLPVSIGEFFILKFHTGSSKGKLLAWLGIHLHSLQQFYLLFVILLITRMLVGFIENFGSYKLAELFVKNIREKIFAAQMSWPPSLLSKSLYGKFLLRYSNDMKAIQNYFSKGILEGIGNLFFLLTGIFLLSKIHLTLTAIMASFLFGITMIIYLIAKFQRSFIKTARTHRSSMLAFVAKTFSSFEKLKLRQVEEEAVDNFNTRSTNLYQANMASNKVESLLQNIAPFMIFLMIGILLWQMTFTYGHISSGDGLMMILMILMMQGAVKKILKVPGYINKGNISLQKISKLLDPQQSAESKEAVEPVSA
jgi:ABC-type multidrug transport system fused ATPase/permease subunit